MVGTSVTESCEGCLQTQFKHLPLQPALILSLQSWKNIRRLFKYNDKFLKTSKQIIYFSYLSLFPPPPPPPSSQDLQRPANIVYGGEGIERKVY